VFEVQDHPAVFGFTAGGDEDELGSPSSLAGSLEVQPGVGFMARGSDLAGARVAAGVSGLGLKEGSDDFAVAVEQPAAVRVRERAGTVPIEEPDLVGLPSRERAVEVAELLEHARRDEIAVPSIQVVMAAHGFGRQMQLRLVGVHRLHARANEIPGMLCKQGAAVVSPSAVVAGGVGTQASH